jgi:hypothetical protein
MDFPDRALCPQDSEHPPRRGQRAPLGSDATRSSANASLRPEFQPKVIRAAPGKGVALRTQKNKL